MKSFVSGWIALALLASVGLTNALHLPTRSTSRSGEVVLPLYSNDSNAVIREKLKRCAAHATIDPSVVLPFLPPPT